MWFRSGSNFYTQDNAKKTVYDFSLYNDLYPRAEGQELTPSNGFTSSSELSPTAYQHLLAYRENQEKDNAAFANLQHGIMAHGTEVENDTCELPAGFYQVGYQHGEAYLKTSEIREESFVEMPFMTELREDISAHLAMKEFFAERNLKFKRGYLLYGAPGDGKSTAIKSIGQFLIDEYGARVIYATNVDGNIINSLIAEKTGQLTVMIFEEFTNTISQGSGPALEFLDGTMTPDNILTFCTTNYPELLPENLIDRPQRLDVQMQIGRPQEEVVSKIAEQILGRGIEAQELNDLMNLHPSAALVKTLCLFSMARNTSITEAMAAHNEQKEKHAGNFKGKKLGFG